MKRLPVILISVLMISVLILSGCSTTPPASTTTKTTTTSTTNSTTTSTSTTSTIVAKTIKFSYTMPKGGSIAKGFDWFGPAFEQATNGRYKVEIYPGATLVAASASIDAAKSGACELVYTSAGSFPKQFPLSIVAQLPSLGYPQSTVKITHASNDAFWEFFKTTPEIQNEFKDVTLVQPLILAPYRLVAKKVQIKSAADFRGLKVGGTGTKMEMVVANGGAKIQQIPPDTYMNMDKGVTDAAFITFSQVYDFKIQEIANFFLDYAFDNAAAVIIMNTPFYNSMGAADQKILLDTLAKAQDVCAQGSIDDNAKGIEVIKAAGKSVYTPTAEEVAAWDSQAAPAIEAWRIDAKKMGATDATLDMIIAKYKTLRTKYLAIGAQ
jgi:TRAP-type C4-dicarboxylate transport system substrate-binding protein